VCQEAINKSEHAAQEVLRFKTPGGVYDVQWNTFGSLTPRCFYTKPTKLDSTASSCVRPLKFTSSQSSQS
jgi:hypothetical protein